MKNWLANQFKTFRGIHVWWRDQLTTVGKMIFLIMLCCLPTFADSDAALAIVFMACGMLLLVASTTSHFYRPRLAIVVTCPRNWMRSENRVLRLEITNRSSNPVFDLQLQLLPQPGIWEIVESSWSSMVLQPGETIIMSSTVKALRRGLFQLPHLQATTLFPLHLVRRSEEHRLARRALIVPFYRPLRSFQLAQFAPRLTRGPTLALQTVGLTGEYVGSREYQPGVPVRKWDYPSWARLGLPVVREFSEPRHPSAAVIVDTFFSNDPRQDNQPIPELEAMLALAAAVTDALIARGNRIDLLVIGESLLASGVSAPSGNQPAILEHLALAQPCAADQFPQLALTLEELPVTWDLAIVLSTHWDTRQQRMYRAVVRGHVRGKRIAVRTGTQTDDNAHPSMPHRVTQSQIEAGLVDL